jgi:hypothetical protein
MIPGPKLDALVAKKVMGWRSLGEHWANGPKHSDRVHKKAAWQPSTCIGHAWEVVQKLAPIVGDFQEADGWFRLLYADSANHGDMDNGCDPGEGETTPEPDDEDLSRWSCHFHPGHPGEGTLSAKLFKDYRKACARGRTAEHAICLAALKVMEAIK